MNERNEKAAQLLAPAFVGQLRNAYVSCITKYGWGFCIVQGWRPGAQQDLDYAQGRTRPGAIITNARAGQSMHQYGLAVDAVPYARFEGGALNWEVASAQYQQFVAEMKGAGLEWGGDWQHLKDEDHFQVAGLPSSPSAEMRADYAAHLSSPEIWAKYLTPLPTVSEAAFDNAVNATGKV